jgi:hypothetical protein
MPSMTCAHDSPELTEAELKRPFAGRKARQRWGPTGEPAANHATPARNKPSELDFSRADTPPPGLRRSETITRGGARPGARALAAWPQIKVAPPTLNPSQRLATLPRVPQVNRRGATTIAPITVPENSCWRRT